MNIGVHLLWIVWNRIKLRRLGIGYGANCKVYNHIRIKKHPGAKVCFGSNLKFTSGGGYNPITSNTEGYLRLDPGAILTIGDNCGFSSTVFWIKTNVAIGNNVQVGGGVLIMDTDCHSLDYRYRNGQIKDEAGNNIDGKMAKTSPIIIEDDVLIGARSIVLKGVTIGARSIIGAGSVVTQSIPADCIAAGNPCKVIKIIEQK